MLYIKSGSRYRPATTSEVCETASGYLLSAAANTRPTLQSPKQAKDFLRMQAGLDREQFGIIYLDQRHRLIDVNILFYGTINGASVHPREVVKAVLLNNSATVIVFHNHPSGNPEPSQADEMITTRLKEALALVDVRLLDHLILSAGNCVSLAELGLL